LGTLVIAILVVSALLDQETGVGIWLELREGLSESTVRGTTLARENEGLRREIEILEAEPAALDRAIREELDLVLPGEIVVRFAAAGAEGRFGRLRDFDRQSAGLRQRGSEQNGRAGSDGMTRGGRADARTEREMW
jgi:cell division protein FtsB